ncbi:hypothetical protein FOZ61_004409, partial [Perkinsus olseni]
IDAASRMDPTQKDTVVAVQQVSGPIVRFCIALALLFLAGCSSDGSSTDAPTSAPSMATTSSGQNQFMSPTTAGDFNGDDDYCAGKPAGEYCGVVNGEMARILIEEHVFYFNYESK